MSKQIMTLEELLAEYQELPEFLGIALKTVNQRGGFQSTPLHIAIYREKPDEISLLLESKADPNASGEYGERPIQVAVNVGNLEIIEQLMRAGALCNLKDDKGTDARDVAKALGFSQKLEEIVGRVPHKARQHKRS